MPLKRKLHGAECNRLKYSSILHSRAPEINSDGRDGTGANAPLLTRGDKPTAEARPLKSNFAGWAVMCDTAGRPIGSMSEAQEGWKRELQIDDSTKQERAQGQAAPRLTWDK
jgi:hypothetical protein